MNLLRYVSARTVSQLGDAVLPVALTFGVLRAGFGPTGVGLTLAASMFPFVALLLVGGVLADRFRPKPVLVTADAARVFSTAFLAWEFVGGRPVLWHIVAAQLVTGIAGAMFEPGSKGLVPEVAPGNARQGYAYLRIAESVVTMAGPALAGLLLAVAEPAAVIALDAASYLLSALLIASVRLPARARPAERPRLRTELAEGRRELTSRRWLCTVLAVFCVLGGLMGGPYQVLAATVLVQDHGPTAYGLLQALFGAGAVIGGLAGLVREPRRPLFVGALAFAAFMPHLWLIAGAAPVLATGAGLLVAGVGRAYWGVMWSTTVQANVPAQALNRISALEVMGSVLLIPVGSAVAGPAAAAVGAGSVLVVSSVAGLVGMAVLVASPAIRGLGGRAAPASTPQAPTQQPETVPATA